MTDAPERTPLSEQLREHLRALHDCHDLPPSDARLVSEVAALEQECEHQREIINGSDHLSRIATLEQATYTCPRCDGEWKAVEGELRALTDTKGVRDE